MAGVAHPQAYYNNEGLHDSLLPLPPKELHIACEVLGHNLILEGEALALLLCSSGTWC
jgi:hypothetical protein